MAERSVNDNRRFARPSANHEFEPYTESSTDHGHDTSSKSLPPAKSVKTYPSTDVTSQSNGNGTPGRRIVVIRGSKDIQNDSGSTDLNESGYKTSYDVPAAPNDNNKSLYLIRRPLAPDTMKQIEPYQKHSEPSAPSSISENIHIPSNTLENGHKTSSSRKHSHIPTNAFKHNRLLSPPDETITSPEQSRSPSPDHSPIQHVKDLNVSTSPIQDNDYQRFSSYLNRSKPKVRTPSPTTIKITRKLPPSGQGLTSTLTVEEPQQQKNNGHLNLFRSDSLKNIDKLNKSSVKTNLNDSRPATDEAKKRKTTADARARSLKSIILINPDYQSIAVVENPYSTGDSNRSGIRRPKSMRRTRFRDKYDGQLEKSSLTQTQSQTCLSCLSRYMCLVIIICSTIVIIGLVGVGVGAYFLASGSVNSFTLPLIGIIIGAVLATAALCFLCIVLACIGSRDGYFTYNNNDKPTAGGRVFALIPSTHPNAHLYIPRDNDPLHDNHQLSQAAASSKTVNPEATPITTTQNLPIIQRVTTSRLSSSKRAAHIKSLQNNLTIEMPERLLTNMSKSPKYREHSLNNVVKNINYIVEDARKRYQGEPLTKVIVEVNKNTERMS